MGPKRREAPAVGPAPRALCPFCARPPEHHGKMVGTCFKDGKALRTRLPEALVPKGKL